MIRIYIKTSTVEIPEYWHSFSENFFYFTTHGKENLLLDEGGSIDDTFFSINVDWEAVEDHCPSLYFEIKLIKFYLFDY